MTGRVVLFRRTGARPRVRGRVGHRDLDSLYVYGSKVGLDGSVLETPVSSWDTESIEVPKELKFSVTRSRH